jgi:hypothetical protein
MEQPDKTSEVIGAGQPQPLTRRKIITFGVALLGAIISATQLPGWHIYVGLGLVAVGLAIALVLLREKYGRLAVPRV